jgi:uncharacterized protein YndB with AHSA1/START domain
MTAQQTTAPVVRAVTVGRSQEDAFRVFTERIADWWPLDRHGVYEGDTAGVFFEDGEVVERSTSGESSVWAEVTEWEPPYRLAMTWHPGADPAESTIVEVDFRADGPEQTRVELVHHGWERLSERAAESRAAYDGGWTGVLGAYAELAGPA